MKKWLDIFAFSRQEFNGLLVLICLIGVVMLVPPVYRLMKPEPQITVAEKRALLQLARRERDKINPGQRYKVTADQQWQKEKPDLFIFDPNSIGQAEWEKLGLSFKQARAILNYRAKGGRFKQVEDLKKMYTISRQMFERLAPYVRITNKAPDIVFKPYPKTNYVKAEMELIELNGADTTELEKIKGIGRVFANRIVKYRERIGGFCKKEQLMEVFGLDSVKYQEIKGQVAVDLLRLRKININTVEFNGLKNHPYIRYKQINALIQYRKQHGNYSNIADLYKVAILNQETIDRLAPYLEF
ncbi:ComEA family DNA-binding protein [Pedobacter africanus]|uniref:Competence protein ComEA helix-hairpin-helix repeat region n=1 Tax=Pedobacter africanus TaxID=151894 RepID=A0A1W2EAR6_9SPHI|nr:helix-hairpin-helix domain-containing protein [Pedobacter africanus]SMD06128.1 competence protein ComEA helix-hairpin-helix repeat region [Pedobacter africanus]